MTWVIGPYWQIGPYWFGVPATAMTLDDVFAIAGLGLILALCAIAMISVRKRR